MYGLAYRNFGNHESIVANHTVDVGNGTPDTQCDHPAKLPRRHPLVRDPQP